MNVAALWAKLVSVAVRSSQVWRTPAVTPSLSVTLKLPCVNTALLSFTPLPWVFDQDGLLV